MNNINLKGSREAILALGNAAIAGQKGFLSLDSKHKKLEFVNHTHDLSNKTSNHQFHDSIISTANFIQDNFEKIIKPEDLKSTTSLKEACKTFDAYLKSSIGHTGFLEDNLNALFFKEHIVQDLELYKGHPYTEPTIIGIITLYLHREKIAEIENETDRNNYITSLTKLTAEPGFCVGNTKKQRISNLEEKMNLLQNSYNEQKKLENLPEYFVNAFKSDPCFNGRITRLTEYVREKQSLPEESFVTNVPTKDLSLLSDIYFKYRESLSKNQKPTMSDFLQYLKKTDTQEELKRYYAMPNNVYEIIKMSYPF